MLVITNVMLIIFSILIFLFLFWKRLKDDYSSNIVFSAGFLIFFGAGVTWFASKYVNDMWTFWVCLLGFLIGLAIVIYKYKMRYFETFDAFIVACVPVLSVVYLNDAVKNSSLFSFIFFIFTLFLLFIFYYIDSNYKKFNWYKSGRIGLAGMVVFLLFFIGKLFTIRSLGLDLLFNIFVVIMALWQLYLIQKT